MIHGQVFLKKRKLFRAPSMTRSLQRLLAFGTETKGPCSFHPLLISLTKHLRDNLRARAETCSRSALDERIHSRHDQNLQIVASSSYHPLTPTRHQSQMYVTIVRASATITRWVATPRLIKYNAENAATLVSRWFQMSRSPISCITS